MAERIPQTFQGGKNLWRFEITVADIRPLREIGLDLDKLNSPESRVKLTYGDEDGGAKACELLFDAALILCEDQIKAAGITEREFAKTLGGDALGDAFMALTEAIICFSHRSDLQAAKAEIRAYRAAMDRVQVAVGKRIDAKVKLIEAMTDDEVLNHSAGNSPVTLA